ncbi:hypothetical protein [Leptospira interrogans]|uniref:hypothetical protein n=1 Tax=Leptospira interrogans TaxID=173 RepID=UPI00046C7D28|nr:hypothetical protein [Leptospira interrogans]
MKLRILILFVCLFVNCYIGTQRDACRYNLKTKDVFGPSDDSCGMIGLVAPLTANGSQMPEGFDLRKNLVLNFLILNCLDYYERLKECDKEENRYIPSIYGFNMKKFSTKKSSVIAVR